MAAPRGAKPNPTRVIGPGDRPAPVPPGSVMVELRIPRGMSAGARQVWRQLVPYLAEQGALVDSDAILLEELCELLAMARQYRKLLQDPPDVALQVDVDPDGEAVFMPRELWLASPAAKRVRAGYLQCLSQANSLASCFGLTPTDRVRLGIMANKGASGLLDVLARLAPSAL